MKSHIVVKEVNEPPKIEEIKRRNLTIGEAKEFQKVQRILVNMWGIAEKIEKERIKYIRNQKDYLER